MKMNRNIPQVLLDKAAQAKAAVSELKRSNCIDDKWYSWSGPPNDDWIGPYDTEEELIRADSAYWAWQGALDCL